MANNAGIGAWHLAQDSLFEVSRNNNYELLVFGLDKLLPAGIDESTATEDDYITGGRDIIRLSVVSCSVPNFTQDEIEISYGNTKFYAAGRPSFSEGKVVVNDYIGKNGKSLLQAWQRLSFDATQITQGIGEMADYKKNAQLVEWDPGFKKIVRIWNIYGLWVKGLDEPEYSYESGDKRQVTATLRYDYAVPTTDASKLVSIS